MGYFQVVTIPCHITPDIGHIVLTVLHDKYEQYIYYLLYTYVHYCKILNMLYLILSTYYIATWLLLSTAMLPVVHDLK